MSTKCKNAVIGQSGGPSSAINSTLSGAILGLLDCSYVDTVYGMKNGIEGFLKKDLVILNSVPRDEIYALAKTPACALGSCRFKLSDEHMAEIFSILEEFNIGYFFYIGGNDSMDTVNRLDKYAKEKSIDVKFIGIPKTIDNDLPLTDHTPGYGSCAKYVATTVLELERDISSYNKPSVTIVEVMGREAGWIGCACALPKYITGTGCDLIYLPESDFSVDRFLSDTENALKIKNNVLCCVCEGIGLGENANGQRDNFGHSFLNGTGKYLEKLVLDYLGCKTRAIEINLLQRCAFHSSSLTDLCESVKIGYSAIDFALCGISGVCLGFERLKGEYGVKVVCNPCDLVANKTKKVPKSFINSEKNGVNEKCIEYLYPLIQGEVQLEYKGGLPNYFKF